MHAKPGEKVNYLVIGDDTPHFGLLGDPPTKHWRQINQDLFAAWRGASDEQKPRLTRMSGCLDKLRTSLLQCDRLRQHHSELFTAARQLLSANGASTAFRGDMACADFEGLLLQGRAALDRLTWFVASEFGNQCSSFRRLSNVLANFRDSRPEAAEIISVCENAKNWLDAVFVKLGSDESLRDLIGHKHAITEGMTTCFGINRITTDRILLFDCEFTLPGATDPTPVLATGRDAAKYLAYVTLNSIGILMGHPALSVNDYEPTWTNQTVSFSQFVVDEPDDCPLGDNALMVVRGMHPGGFEVTTRNMRPDLLNRAVKVP